MESFDITEDKMSLKDIWEYTTLYFRYRNNNIISRWLFDYFKDPRLFFYDSINDTVALPKFLEYIFQKLNFDTCIVLYKCKSAPLRTLCIVQYKSKFYGMSSRFEPFLISNCDVASISSTLYNKLNQFPSFISIIKSDEIIETLI